MVSWKFCKGLPDTAGSTFLWKITQPQVSDITIDNEVAIEMSGD